MHMEEDSSPTSQSDAASPVSVGIGASYVVVNLNPHAFSTSKVNGKFLVSQARDDLVRPSGKTFGAHSLAMQQR